MFSIFTVAFFFIVIALLFLLLGVVVRVEKFRAFYKIAMIFFLLFILLSINWGPSSEERKLFTGKYLIDTLNSEISHKKLSKYSDLTVTVKKDLSFEINRPSPFFVSTTGTWDYDDRADYQILSYKFSSSYNEHQIFPLDGNVWKLETTDPNGKTISFKRIVE
ncbi:hypothetical protein GCM10028819_15560 [Spirosoma humi]